MTKQIQSNTYMFEPVIKFSQADLIDEFGKKVKKNSQFAQYKLPFLEYLEHLLPGNTLKEYLKGEPTVKNALKQTSGGWCWGIVAELAARLERIMSRAQPSAENYKSIFQTALKEIESFPIRAMSFQLMQPILPRRSIYANPPDMQSPFSIWCASIKETGEPEPSLHAVLSSNRVNLDLYFIFDSNAGLYESSRKLTRALNDVLERRMSQGVARMEAMREVISKATLAFLKQAYTDYESVRLHSPVNNIVPHMSSREAASIVTPFEEIIKPFEQQINDHFPNIYPGKRV